MSQHPGWPATLTAGPVLLRPPRLRDGRAWSELRLRNEQWLEPWEPSSPATWAERSSVAAWPALHSALRRGARAGTMLPFMIWYGGRLVGQINASNVALGVLRSCTVGYWVDQRVAGRGITPTAVAFTQVKSIVKSPLAKKGATVVTVPDLRWKRCDIKSVGLLPQVMAKQIAARAGAHEAWMTDGDRVTEGASSTAFIITADQRLITRPLSNAVLPGITRVSILALAREHGLTLEERTFTVAEAQQAAEAFYTSASTFVMPVVFIDGVQIGNGQPGPLTQALRTLYLRFAGVDVAEPVGQM